jgi:hypothetical protein
MSADECPHGRIAYTQYVMTADNPKLYPPWRQLTDVEQQRWVLIAEAILTLYKTGKASLYRL